MRIYKNIKIAIVGLVVVSLLFGVNFGLIYAISKLDLVRGTSVARDVQPSKDLDWNNLDKADIEQMTKELNELGGELDVYDSEADYHAAVAKEEREIAREIENDLALQADKPSVKSYIQTIVVMSVATGSEENQNYIPSMPIKNALVRIDGVPRYTDSNGKLTLQIDKDYVELYVQKNDYNPHIEMLAVTGQDKVVYLKQPSDDLDIYSVYMYQEGVGKYVDKQLSSVYNEEEANATITLSANTQVDKTIFIMDGIEQEYEGDSFEYSFFGLDDNAQFAIAYEYNGIRSKVVHLQIRVFSQVEIDMAAFDGLGWGADLEADSPPSSRAGNIFGKFEVDLAPLFDLLFKGRKGSGKLDFAYDRVANTVEIVLGYEFKDALGDKGKWNEGKREEFDSIDKYFDNTSSLRGVKNNLAKLDKYIDTLQDLGLDKKKFLAPSKGGFKPDLELNFSIAGKLTLDLSNHQNSQFVVMGAVSFEIKFGGQFLLWFVPCYWEAGFGLDVELDLGIQGTTPGFFQNIEFKIDLMISIWAKIGAGIGINGLLSAGLYGKLEFKNEFNLYPTPSHDYMSLTLGVYYKICALFYNREGPIYEYEWVFKDNKSGQIGSDNQFTALPRTNALNRVKSQSVAFDNAIDGVLIDNIYQNAAPKLVRLSDDRELMVWQTDDATRTSSNRTKLMYSILDNGVWGSIKSVSDSNTADFYHSLYTDDNGDVYLAWQSTKALVNEDITDINDIYKIASLGEIKVARFDSINNEFADIKTLTDNDYMDTNPTFAVKESDSNPTTVVWQSNSDSNMLGDSGTSAIWASSLVGGVWQKPIKMYSADNKILEYSAGYKGGELYVATLVDNDNMDVDSNANTLYVSSALGTTNIVGKNTVYKSSPRFALADKQVNLYWYDVGGVMYSPNYNSPKNAARLIADSELVGRAFDIQSNADELIFSYIDTETGFRQLKASVLSLVDNTWSHNIALSDGEHNVIDNDIVPTDMGFKIASVVERQTDKGSYYSMAIAEIEFATDVSIEQASFLSQTDSDNNFVIDVAIHNNGNTSLDSLTFELLGYSITPTLETKLYPDRSTWVMLTIPTSAIVGLDNIVIDMLYLKDKQYILLDSYDLDINVVYYKIAVETIGRKGNQVFAINVSNFGLTYSAYTVAIKRVDTDELVDRLYSADFVDGMYNYIIDYSAVHIPLDTEIVFELETVTTNAYAIGIKSYAIADGDIYNNQNSVNSEWADLLGKSKTLLV